VKGDEKEVLKNVRGFFNGLASKNALNLFEPV
jgi:hypothetical protein